MLVQVRGAPAWISENEISRSWSPFRVPWRKPMLSSAPLGSSSRLRLRHHDTPVLSAVRTTYGRDGGPAGGWLRSLPGPAGLRADW